MKIMLKIVLAQLIVAGLIFAVFTNVPTKERKLIEHKIPCDYLESRYETLIDSVADLEQKAEILNRYLSMKHLEYIDACNLVQRKKN
jgi:hypothetical protein